MRSTSDPSRTWARRERATLAAGLSLLALSLAWAWWPLPDAPPVAPAPRPPADASPPGPEAAGFNRAAFAAHIWNPRPAPESPAPAPRPAPAPAPAPDLQLIGIVRDAGEEGRIALRAAIYDPAADRIHLVAPGERIRDIAVASVDELGVSLERAGRAIRLALRDDGRGGGR